MRANGYFDVRDYDGIGITESEALQAAIDAATPGGLVNGFGTSSRECNNVILKAGVTLDGGAGAPGYRAGNVGRPVLLSTLPGWAIDTPAARIESPSIIGLSVQGPGGGGASGGIRFRNVAWGNVKNVNVHNFANEGIAILDGPSFACGFEDVLTTLVVLDRARTTPIGGIDINGTDHYFTRVEGSTGGARSAPGLSSPAFYIPAFMVRGYTHRFTDTTAEFSDVGYYCTGGYLQFTQGRADDNFGHGWLLADGSSQLTGCLSFRNGLEATNTYSGYSITGATRRHQLTGCRDASEGPFVHKYGIDDHITYPALLTEVTGHVSYGAATAERYP